MANENIEFHRPPEWLQTLEKLGIAEVTPWHIARDVDALYKKFPDLAGDNTAIGVSDSDGHCQSWRHNRGWWEKLSGMPKK